MTPLTIGETHRGHTTSGQKHAFARPGRCSDRRRVDRPAKPLVTSGARPVSGRGIVGSLSFYDPTTGQFLTRDPIEPLTRSAYSYVYGNPLNLVDPTGLCGWSDPMGCVEDVADVAGAGGELIGSTVEYVEETIKDAWNKEWEKDWGTALAGSTNMMLGGTKMMVGGALIVGAASCGPLIALCVGAGAYGIGSGGLRSARGIRQLYRFDQDPYPGEGDCTTGDNLVRFARGVMPFGGSDWLDFLGGLP